MKLWICVEANDRLFVGTDSSKDRLLSKAKEASAGPGFTKKKIYRWHVWQVDVDLNKNFLLSIINPNWSYLDLPKVKGTWETKYTRAGRWYRMPDKRDHKNPNPSSWST